MRLLAATSGTPASQEATFRNNMKVLRRTCRIDPTVVMDLRSPREYAF